MRMYKQLARGAEAINKGQRGDALAKPHQGGGRAATLEHALKAWAVANL